MKVFNEKKLFFQFGYLFLYPYLFDRQFDIADIKVMNSMNNGMLK